MDITIDKHEIERFPLKKYFGIDESYDSGWGEKLDAINEWGQKRGFKTYDDMLVEIKKIEAKLGSTNLGEDRLTRLKNYLSLDQKLSEILKEMGAYESNT